MKILIDAQLPRLLANYFRNKGFDAIHTLDLPKKNATPDDELLEVAKNQDRIIITKDYDFYETKLLKGIPRKLIFILTGNISNNDLIELVNNNLEKILELINKYEIVEIDRISIKAR